MAVLDFKITVVERPDGAHYGRYRLIRRAADGDRQVWKGAAATGATHRVWSWRTGFWPSPTIEALANALQAGTVITRGGVRL